MSEKVYVQVGVKGRSIPVGGEAGQVLQKNSDNDFDCVWTTPAGGTSANIPQPATTTPLSDKTGGAVGTGVSFARSDHQHELNVSSTVTDVKMNGTRSLGSAGTYAKTDHVHPSDTYASGFEPAGDIILTDEVHIFDSVDDLPAAGTAGRIAFVKVGGDEE